MRPVLFFLGPIHLYAFGAMILLGVFVSLFLMERRAKRDGFPKPGDVFDLVFVTVLAGLAGARLLYVWQNFGWYRQRPLHAFALWEGGLIFYGGLVTAFLAFYLAARVKKIPFVKGLDFILPYAALTHAFGRIGCFLNGCCYGKACDLPWAVHFPEFPEGVRVHPTQLYEALFLFGIFLFLNARYPVHKRAGEISVWYFLLYGSGRFLVEFYRGDNPVWFFLTANQWISLAVISTAAAFYFFVLKPSKAGKKSR